MSLRPSECDLVELSRSDGEMVEISTVVAFAAITIGLLVTYGARYRKLAKWERQLRREQEQLAAEQARSANKAELSPTADAPFILAQIGLMCDPIRAALIIRVSTRCTRY